MAYPATGACPYFALSWRTDLLASLDLGFTHAGLPALRPEALGSPPDQCAAPRRQYSAGLLRIHEDDRGFLAVCGPGCALLCPPTPSGHRGLGCGAQESAKHPFLAADDLGLRALRGTPRVGAVCIGFAALCAGPDVQTGAGHTSLCANAVGLLAAAPIPTHRPGEAILNPWPSAGGEGAAVPAGRCIQRSHSYGASQPGLAGGLSWNCFGSPHRKRLGLLSPLPGQYGVAH